MGIRKWKITARGWPWQVIPGSWANDVDQTGGQKWGWNPFKVKDLGRFGGGWAFKFGMTASKSMRDFVFDLGIGSIRITKSERGDK